VIAKILRIIIPVLMIANGLMFLSGSYVLGDREAAIEMHEDIAPTASDLMVNAKVVISFVVGILYLIAAYGIIRKKYGLSLAGVIGFAIFDGFYVIELVMWGKTNPYTWIGFSIFGSLALLFGACSLWIFRKRGAR